MLKHRIVVRRQQYVDDTDNPRLTQENLGTMIAMHSRYTLGDVRDFRKFEWFELQDNRVFSMRDDEFLETDEDKAWAEENGWEEPPHLLRLLEKAVAVLPIYLYDHSGITMHAGEGMMDLWDTSHVGWIIAEPEAVAANGWDPANPEDMALIKQVLRGEVEEYDNYLTGEIWCVSTEWTDEEYPEEGDWKSEDTMHGINDGWPHAYCEEVAREWAMSAAAEHNTPVPYYIEFAGDLRHLGTANPAEAIGI